jgi:hypothetical protein
LLRMQQQQQAVEWLDIQFDGGNPSQVLNLPLIASALSNLNANQTPKHLRIKNAACKLQAKHLTSLFQTCSLLCEVHIVDTPLSRFHESALPCNLRKLVLSGCGLAGKQVNALLKEMTCPRLRVLLLNNNKISSLCASALATLFSRSPKLCGLDFNDNLLVDQDVDVLVGAAVGPSLRWLLLEGNRLTNACALQLVAALNVGKLEGLRWLNLKSEVNSGAGNKICRALDAKVDAVMAMRRRPR